MLIVDASTAALSWLGRQGTRAVAALVVIGIALPSIGAILKPYVSVAVFVLLSIAFLRIDIAGVKSCLRRPAIVIAATAWTSMVVPVLFGASCLMLGTNRQAPDLFLALMLQGVASPMMAAPGLAALMGLDATLVLVTLIASTVLIPLTAPLFALIFVGPGLSISPLALAARLFAILAGAAFVGFVLRRVVGVTAIDRQEESINGLNILVLFVFVAAVMESVGARFLAAPMMTIALAILAFGVFFAVLFLTALLFLFGGRKRALALAFMASQRNMGLILAVTGGALPDLTWLYFALSQFPIYLSPQLFRPLVRRVLGNAAIEHSPVEFAPPGQI